MKRERTKPSLTGRNDEAPGASRTSRKRENKYASEAVSDQGGYASKRYAPPTIGAASASYRQYNAKAALSPISDANVGGMSPTGERPPSRVFFPKNNTTPLAMDDSLTIDSELDDLQASTTPRQPHCNPTSPSSSGVYHLARDGDVGVVLNDSGVRKPSPKHRAKLEAWYRKNALQQQQRQQSQRDGRMRRGTGSRQEEYQTMTALERLQRRRQQQKAAVRAPTRAKHRLAAPRVDV